MPMRLGSRDRGEFYPAHTRKKRWWLPWVIAGMLLTVLAAASVPFIASYLVFGGIPKTTPLAPGSAKDLPGDVSPQEALEELKSSDVFDAETPEDLPLPTVEPGTTVEDAKDQIVEKAKRNIPSVAGATKDEILSHTDEVCANLDDGWGPIQLATQMELPVHGLEERAKFLGLAVSMGCPEYTNEALGWYDQLKKFKALQG